MSNGLIRDRDPQARHTLANLLDPAFCPKDS